ncbi:MAG: histidine kinase [Prosthecobacter sp.]
MTVLNRLNTRLSLLMLFALILVGANWWRNQSRNHERVLQRFETEMMDTGIRLAGMMQFFVRRGLVSPAELEMSYAAASPHLELGAVCDCNDMVRFSTQLQWNRTALSETPLRDALTLTEQARVAMSPLMVSDDAGAAITGAFPFYEEYNSRNRGVLLLRYDTSAVLRHSAREAALESFAQACAVLALCLLLWLALDVMLTRRLKNLADYARKVGGEAGDTQGEIADELSLVTRSFEESVANLRSSELRLVEAAEVERRRIGADLHDDVCQRLSAAQLKIGVLESALKREDHAQATLAGAVADDLAKATRVARGFAHGLAPMLVQKGRLEEALQDLAGMISESFSVRCECLCDLGEKALGVWVDTHIYRIIQELATNAAKHAKPSLIEVAVKVTPELLTIQVASDGGGLLRTSGEGIGMALVAQRVRALGGHWHIQAREKSLGGSIASCEVPLEARHFSDEG